MTAPLDNVLSTLSATPLFGITLTLLVYLAALHIHQRCRRHPLTNPVLLALAAMTAILLLTGIPYSRYFDGARFIHFLLGPATVALALPLYTQIRRIQALALPVSISLLAGCLIGIVSAVWIASAAGGSLPTILSVAPKSVTTPIAMGITEKVGGLASLTAVIVIVTGVVGAVLCEPIFRWLNVQGAPAQGFAIGMAAHGVGTAKAFMISEEAGAFAALALGLNGLLTAVIVPILLPHLIQLLS